MNDADLFIAQSVSNQVGPELRACDEGNDSIFTHSYTGVVDGSKHEFTSFLCHLFALIVLSIENKHFVCQMFIPAAHDEDLGRIERTRNCAIPWSETTGFLNWYQLPYLLLLFAQSLS